MKYHNTILKKLSVLFILAIFAIPLNLIGQNQVLANLYSKMNLKQISSVYLLEDVSSSIANNKYAELIDPSLLESATFFELDLNAINSLKNADVDLMTVPLEIPGYGQLEIAVYRQSIFAPNLKVESSTGLIGTKDAKKILFYRGVVMNVPNTLVSLTILENEISGVISIGSDNFNLGKIKGMSTHILYNDKDLDLPHDFVCGVVDEEFENEVKPIVTINADKTTQCVGIRVEVDNGLNDQLGGFTQSVNYVAGLYNEVITLYDNDNITVNVVEVFVWQGSSPYSGSSSAILNQMSNTSPVADLTTLVSSQGSGGIAYLSGLCSTSNAVNFNSVNGVFSNVPTFSWDVEVVAHEMGHNLDSPHTHACAWNGNNTAIDGCGPEAGYSEGCSGSVPSAGGTIMSYCHLTAVGINFNFGLGAQPRQRIIDYVESSNCLGTVCVEVDPTCDDGIQNGTETGVDCGGADCVDCPTCTDGIQNGTETDIDCGGSCAPCDCDDAGLNLTINLDNYPQETSWELINASNVTVESGGTYGDIPDNTSISIPLCIPAGCYDFVIYDSYGDGICCGFGNGSYSLTDFEGTVVADGGNFDDSETTNFCVEAPNSAVQLNLKTLLEGPYSDANSLMSDNLRSAGNVPLSEPYSAMGYSVPSTSTNIVALGVTGGNAIVDWVLLELRSEANPTVVIQTQAALVQRDGDIVSVDGVSPVEMEVGTESNVYVAIRHRNHFGIRTANTFSTASTIAVDFSDPSTLLFGSSNAVILFDGVSLMVSGDANTDGQINSIDKNSFWRIQNGLTYDYQNFRSDFNLDGVINSVDKNFHWRVNNSKVQQLD